MVRKRSPLGHYYHVPPYTEEEELEFYRRTAGVVSFTRRAPAIARPKQELSENGDGGSDG
jgi:hypothetical protein